MKMLLDAGADPNGPDGDGLPLEITFSRRPNMAIATEAAVQALQEQINMLLAYGADPGLNGPLLFEAVRWHNQASGSESRNTDDIASTLAFNEEFVEMLLAAGIDVNLKNQWGETALDWAEASDMIALLLDAGAKRSS